MTRLLTRQNAGTRVFITETQRSTEGHGELHCHFLREQRAPRHCLRGAMSLPLVVAVLCSPPCSSVSL